MCSARLGIKSVMSFIFRMERPSCKDGISNLSFLSMKASHPVARPPVIDDQACRGFQTAIEIVGRRWTAAVLRALAVGAERFGDIRWRVHGISDRLLALRLKELEAEGLIIRTVVPTTPVQVLYGLSKRGRDLTVALQPLIDWGVAAKGPRWTEHG